MNKRILSILLCLMLVVSLLVLAVPVNAAPSSVDLTITADKTEAKPGDTVNFTVTLGPVSELGGLAFSIAIPDGLTFVEGSGSLSVTKADLGFDDLYFDEAPTYRIGGVASAADYESTSDTEICTFQCTVNDDATGTQTVSATIVPAEWFSCQTWETWGDKVSVGDADVTITGETEAPATEAPVTEAPVTEAPVTEAPVTEAPVTEAPVTEAPATEAPATEAHVHDNPLTSVPEVPATYEKDGTKAYYVCESCGQKFWDAFGDSPVEKDEDLIIPKLEPTEAPTDAPTEEPTTDVTEEATTDVTEDVTEEVTEEPTEVATEDVTEEVTEEPTEVEPTEEEPTENPATPDEPTENPATPDEPTEKGEPTYAFEKDLYDYYMATGGTLIMVAHNTNPNYDDNDTFSHFQKLVINGKDVTDTFQKKGSLQIVIPQSSITGYFNPGKNKVECYFDDATDPAVTTVDLHKGASGDQSSGDTKTPDPASTSPKTGDTTHMYLWMLIMFASLAGAVAVVYTAKRKGIFTK